MNERTVNTTRVFDAPRERVFAAWIRAELLALWFSPKGFTIPSCDADPRPGGAFRLVMRSPDGKAMIEGMPEGWAQTVDRLNAHLVLKP